MSNVTGVMTLDQLTALVREDAIDTRPERPSSTLPGSSAIAEAARVAGAAGAVVAAVAGLAVARTRKASTAECGRIYDTGHSGDGLGRTFIQRTGTGAGNRSPPLCVVLAFPATRRGQLRPSVRRAA